MKTVRTKTKKTLSTIQVFLICFAVYFICNTYSK